MKSARVRYKKGDEVLFDQVHSLSVGSRIHFIISFGMRENDDKLLSSTMLDRTESCDDVLPSTHPSSNSSSMSKKNTDGLMNPMQTKGRVRSHPFVARSISATMRDNADGTVSIYTTGAERSKVELYTEIPMIALYGMETRGGVNQDNDTSGHWKIDETRPVSSKVTIPLCVAALAAAILQFLVGINLVILNTPEEYVFPHHDTLKWALAVSALAIGAPFGSFLGGWISTEKGRRFTIFITALIFLVGELFQALAPSLLVLTIGRGIIGVASGISTALVPVYLGELAPPSLRGRLGTITQFAMVMGILVAALLSFKFATEDLWRHLFLFPVFISIIQLAMIPFVLESPVWLLEKDIEDRDLATRVLMELRGATRKESIDAEMASYIRSTKIQNETGGNQWQMLLQMMRRRHERRLFLCLFLLHSAQQLCGINAIFYYSTRLLSNVIDNTLVATTLIGTVNVIFTYVALLLMDSRRRKTLLLWSFGGMFLSCVVLILAQMGVFGSWVALISVNCYVAFYEVGVGPIPWLVIAEMFEAKYVAAVMSIIAQWSWVANFVVSLTFPPLHKVLEHYTFVPFAVILVISFVFTSWMFPETHRKTPAEVMANVKEEAAAEDRGRSILPSCYDRFDDETP